MVKPYLVIVVVVMVRRRGGGGTLGLRFGPLPLRARLLEVLGCLQRLPVHACNKKVGLYFSDFHNTLGSEKVCLSCVRFHSAAAGSRFGEVRELARAHFHVLKLQKVFYTKAQNTIGILREPVISCNTLS